MNYSYYTSNETFEKYALSTYILYTLYRECTLTMLTDSTIFEKSAEAYDAQNCHSLIYI